MLRWISYSPLSPLWFGFTWGWVEVEIYFLNAGICVFHNASLEENWIWTHWVLQLIVTTINVLQIWCVSSASFNHVNNLTNWPCLDAFLRQKKNICVFPIFPTESPFSRRPTQGFLLCDSMFFLFYFNFVGFRSCYYFLNIMVDHLLLWNFNSTNIGWH